MKSALFTTLLCTGLLFWMCNSPQKPMLSVDKQKLEKASRTEKDGWILVHLEGTPQVIGYQHGYLLAGEIADLRNTMKMLSSATTSKKWDFYREESYRLFWKQTPEEYRQEMLGITEGVNVKLGAGTIDIKDIVAMNSYMETTGYLVPWLEEQEKPLPAEHCSAIIATGSWTKDGKIVVAHNNWSEYVLGERWNIILDIKPEHGNRFVMDALPGYIHSGDDFNINNQGLVVTETTISSFEGFDPKGIAEFIRARKAIQYAGNIDEWVAIMLKGNNGGYANDWLLADNKTGEIARLELGLKNHFLERTRDGYYTGANFPVHSKLIREETNFDTLCMEVSSNIRRLRWNELMETSRGKIDVALAQSFMADHKDLKRKQEKGSRFTLCGHMDTDRAGRKEISWEGAFFHAGAVQAKVTDGTLAEKMQFWARMGHPCGEKFDAEEFLKAQPYYSFEKEFLRDMPGHPWMLTSPIP